MTWMPTPLSLYLFNSLEIADTYTNSLPTGYKFTIDYIGIIAYVHTYTYTCYMCI